MASPAPETLSGPVNPPSAAGTARPRPAGIPAATDSATPPSPTGAAAPPVTLTFRLDGLDLARYDAIMARLRRLGHRQPRENLLLEALAAYAESLEAGKRAPVATEAPEDSGHGAKSSCSQVGYEQTQASSHLAAIPFTRVNSCAYQVVLYRCTSCGEAKVVTSHGARPVTRRALERAECDAQVLRPDGSQRSTIPPSVRRAVLIRDGHRCQIRGCGRTQFLEVHHIRPRSEGGSDKPENLTTTCALCHQLLHERGLALPLRGRT